MLTTLAVNVIVSADEESLPVPRNSDGSVIISGEPGDFVGIWVPVYFVEGRGPTFNFDECTWRPMAKGLCIPVRPNDLNPQPA